MCKMGERNSGCSDRATNTYIRNVSVEDIVTVLFPPNRVDIWTRLHFIVDEQSSSPSVDRFTYAQAPLLEHRIIWSAAHPTNCDLANAAAMAQLWIGLRSRYRG